MRLAGLEILRVAPPPPGWGGRYWTLVKLTTACGITGWGEVYAATVGPRAMDGVIADVFARHMEGEDPENLELMFRRAYSAGFSQRPDPTVTGAFSGLEIACWDILGKARGRPVWAFLGGRTNARLRAYSYLYPGPGSDVAGFWVDPDRNAEAAARLVAAGFTAVKFDPAGPYTIRGGHEPAASDISRSVAFCRAIRDAVGLHWLGTQLARKTPPLAFFGPAHQPLIRDAAGARQAFEDAVARDPDNEDAWLGLLALLDDTQQLSERNRLLDKLVARFPGNKTLLLQAGARAIERKAFGKAAKFLRQALALDPLDLLAKSTLVAALLRQTLENRNKDKSSPEVWDEIDLLVADRPPADPHMLGRWTVRLKRGLIDPDPAAAAHAMEEARRRAPSARERLFLERALVLGHDLPRRPEWDEEWAAAPPASWHELGAMLDVLVFATRLKHWAPRICRPCGALLEKTLADVLRRKLLPEDPPGALAFFRRLKNASPHAQSWPIPRIVADALRPKINAYLKKTPGAAPEIRLIHLELLAADGTLHPSQSVLNRLDRLIADATTARLTHVVDEARHLKKQLEQGMGAPRGFVPPFDDRFFDGPTDSDDKDFDEDWDDDAEDDWDQCAASLSIHAAEVLTGMTPQLACAILQGDNATILQLRRQAIAQGVPGVIFDRVVREGPDSIDRTQGRRGQTSGRSRRRSRKSSDTDYRQLDLFGP